MDEAQLWDAVSEMNKQGLIIGTLLGGFTLNAAMHAFSKPWRGRVHKLSSISVFISAVSFLCVVCISALVVFSFADYEFLISLVKENQNLKGLLTSNMFFLWLSIANLVVGFFGMFSLFVMFSLVGWERGAAMGIFTTFISVMGMLVIAVTFLNVYSTIVAKYFNFVAQ